MDDDFVFPVCKLSNEEIMNDPILPKALAFSNFFSHTTPMMHMVKAFVYAMVHRIEGTKAIPDDLSGSGIFSFATTMAQPIREKYKYCYGVDGEMSDDAIAQLFTKHYMEFLRPVNVRSNDLDADF